MPTNSKTTREIERKFLVKRLPRGLSRYPDHEIEQGYLASERDIQIRLRKDGRAYSLTYKRGGKGGREEREVRLSKKQFDALWPATAGRRLTKCRYDVPYRRHTVEVDVYRGRNEGVIVAEVEFADEKSCREFVAPDWLGKDVTDQARYSNVLMAQE